MENESALAQEVQTLQCIEFSDPHSLKDLNVSRACLCKLKFEGGRLKALPDNSKITCVFTDVS